MVRKRVSMPSDAPADPQSGEDWLTLGDMLASAAPGQDTDDLIDKWSSAALAEDSRQDIGDAMRQALLVAQSTPSRNSAALALAATALPTDIAASDALLSAYRAAAGDTFLAASLLTSLGLFALRSPVARAEVLSQLLRLQSDGPRYVLIAAAKVIGWLDNAHPAPDLRGQLATFLDADDPAVVGEARQQLALITFAEAFLAPTRPDLWERLTAARAAFARVEATEEHRPDAAMFRLLCDALLSFQPLAQDQPPSVALLSQLATQVENLIIGIDAASWHDYMSDTWGLIALRVAETARALRNAAIAADEADSWTNFDVALVETAGLYILVRATASPLFGYEQLSGSLGMAADSILAPVLGPLLVSSLGANRFDRVIERYATHPEARGEIVAALQAFRRAGGEVIGVTDRVVHDAAANRIRGLAGHLKVSPGELVDYIGEAIQQDSLDDLARRLGIGTTRLPIEQPNLFGGDPDVDATARFILHELRDRFQDRYPRPKWMRLVTSVVEIVAFAKYVRDVLPDYARCTADGGKGQGASEDDLQAHLLQTLRGRFGQHAVNEWGQIGGGRPDLGLIFAECSFPIEVKHEFKSVERDHVRVNFLTQPDIYASVTDRITFLMILDLRGLHAYGHREAAGRQENPGAKKYSLYSLQASFWIDSLPSDPQIQEHIPNAVIVGLIPGNRTRPSSTTNYSRRPAKARKRSTKPGVEAIIPG